jgi:hypothetical protein
MFTSKTRFEENKLSDTVVEFKITDCATRNPVRIIATIALLLFTIWSFSVRKDCYIFTARSQQWYVQRFVCFCLVQLV